MCIYAFIFPSLPVSNEKKAQQDGCFLYCFQGLPSSAEDIYIIILFLFHFSSYFFSYRFYAREFSEMACTI